MDVPVLMLRPFYVILLAFTLNKDLCKSWYSFDSSPFFIKERNGWEKKALSAHINKKRLALEIQCTLHIFNQITICLEEQCF